MGKMIPECEEVVLKRMTQSWGSYLVINGKLRHILSGSYNGGCAARRVQVTLYGKIWFMYALRYGGVSQNLNLYVIAMLEYFSVSVIVVQYSGQFSFVLNVQPIYWKSTVRLPSTTQGS